MQKMQKDSKKLKAAVALTCLSHLYAIEHLSETDKLKVQSLCDRLIKIALYSSEENIADACTEYAIEIIEEYLQEQGV